MSRSQVGHVSGIIIVTLTLVLITSPIASARPLASPHPLARPPAVDIPADWISAVAHWIAGLFAGQAPATSQAARFTSVSTASTSLAQILTGSCVDPNGHPVPCGPF